jgi:hypothetical protein
MGQIGASPSVAPTINSDPKSSIGPFDFGPPIWMTEKTIDGGGLVIVYETPWSGAPGWECVSGSAQDYVGYGAPALRNRVGFEFDPQVAVVPFWAISLALALFPASEHGMRWHRNRSQLPWF